MRRSGELVCWGPDLKKRREVWTPPAGASTQVDLSSTLACALRTGATAAGWGILSTEHVGTTRAPAGQFTAVNACDWHACGLRPSQEMMCWLELP